MINLEAIINNNYSIKVLNIEKNIDSTDGNVYMITSDTTKYVDCFTMFILGQQGRRDITCRL